MWVFSHLFSALQLARPWLYVEGEEELVSGFSPKVINELLDQPVLSVESAPHLRIPCPPPLRPELVPEIDFAADQFPELGSSR